MKKLLLITTGLIALGSAAQAADLAARPYTKAPPMVAAAIYDWSGFYIGINGGGGWSHDSWSVLRRLARWLATMRPAAPSVARSAIAGRPARWCSASKLRATGPISRATTSVRCSPASPTTPRPTRSACSPARSAMPGTTCCCTPRAVRPSSTTSTISTRLRRCQPGSTSDTRWGGTVGAGLEYGFAPNWSLGFEYDHIFLGRQNFTFGWHRGTDSIKQDVDLFTARLNYKFGGPVIAKY